MKIFTESEALIYKLRELYEKYGYRLFKMSKFEEYSFYMEHKNFLTTENIISFNDLDGRLLALKPDITLSIAKNAKDGENVRVYYNENVYRTSRGIHEYREIPQVGLECIGDIDTYTECETVLLAANSMAVLGEQFTLDLSHIGFVSALLSCFGLSEAAKCRITALLQKKDAEGIYNSCIEDGIKEENAKTVSRLSEIHGSFENAMKEARELCACDDAKSALDELSDVYAFLSRAGYGKNINLDFSIINDMSYYNGIVFQGYLETVPKNVLSGGRYDKLLEKLGKKSLACGFAIYLDLIELYSETDTSKKLDFVVKYKEGDDIGSVLKFADSLRENGARVMVVRAGNAVPEAEKIIVFGKDSGEIK